MAIQTLTRFFMWCTIVNGGLLVISAVFLTFCRGFVYRIHSTWFPMPREVFDVVIYSFLGLLKILFFMFNVVPYVALLIIG